MLDQTLGPAYNCHRCDRPQRDVEHGCPTCLLTTTVQLRDRGMPFEWARYVHEDPNEGMRDLPAIGALLAVVADAIRTLPEGRSVDPSWPPAIAELAVVYRDEVDRYRRELEREASDRQRAAARGT